MKQFYMLLTILLCSSTAYCQLSDFSLTVTKTDETCLGNGSLSFSVTNVTKNTSILYKIYVMPDNDNPIAVTTANYLGSLSAATYKVVAIQSLGNESNKKEKIVTIENKIVPFAIDIETSTYHCQGNGDLIVTATSGTGANYEILSGPVTRPLQTSNIFTDLPGGTYNIRAFDICGVGKVRTYTLTVFINQLNISDTSYPDAIGTICDSIKVMNVITPTEGAISYPLTVESTLAPLSIGGNAIVVNQTFQTGSPSALNVSMVVPRYFSESYTYDIKVTDNCEQIFEKNNNIVDPNIDVALTSMKAPCAEKYIQLNASRYTTSYTVKFLTAPEGFNAGDYNATPNGPFTAATVNYGSETNTVPFGNYVIEITDICGRKSVDSLKVEFIKPKPTQYGVNNGCFSLFGYIRSSLPDSSIVSAIITAAPSNYTGIIPENVSTNITNDGILALNDLPLGVYKITIIDDCDFTYEMEIEVPPYIERNFSINPLPGCAENFGSVRLSSGNGILTQASVISAPSSFSHPLPYNATSKIASDGVMYMDELPAGTYTFKGTDICGIVKDMEVIVEGYHKPVNTFTFTPNCGSFSVFLDDNSNGVEGAGYWLQYYDENLQTWVNPIHGVPYVEGSVPDDTTGIVLANHQTRYNFDFSGKLRIIKKFESFGDGTVQNTMCVSVLGEFTYIDDLAISAAYTLACAGQPNDVILEILGYPVVYKIREKNGQPFYVDNGANNIFTNLEPAEYLFQIEDACGNIDIKGFNVQSLPSLTDATKPSDMIFCAEPGEEDSFEFHLTDQNPQILGSFFPAMYTITYHLNQDDADNGTNALPEYYNNITNGQVIYARLIHNEISLCHGTTSFKLFVGEKPVPVITTKGTICNEGTVTITAESGFKSYLWSTGQTGRTIIVDTPGIYTLTVEKAYGDERVCTGTNEVEIKTSVTPTITKIDTSDWTRDQNTITVYAEGSGNYEYSLDGVNYQAENTFEGLETGVYQIYVRDALGCGEDVQELVLMNYPNFFTPNGDGHNDRWKIEYSIKEPHLNVDIFDRYGKLITTFGPTSAGWDGKLNGIDLPSTDYWFVVTREDGRILKGHFSMLR